MTSSVKVRRLLREPIHDAGETVTVDVRPVLEKLCSI